MRNKQVPFERLVCFLIFLTVICLYSTSVTAYIKDVSILDRNTGESKQRCIVEPPIDILSLEDKHEKWIKDHISSSVNGKHARATPVNNTYINVYFHVINKGYDYASGYLNDSMISSQIDALNYGFDGSGYVFVLNQTDRTTNSVWFNMTQGSTIESQAKTRLRKGGAADLNIYTVAPGDGSLGWGSYPWDYSKVPIGDGVVILYTTTPNGTCPDYNLGNTLNHEVGHWMGLYHTFQGGCCDGTSCGDYVTDTPAEASPTYGCPSKRDSCNSTGSDSIGDYMNYSTDICTSYFTRGQANRMISMFNMYRKSG